MGVQMYTYYVCKKDSSMYMHYMKIIRKLSEYFHPARREEDLGSEILNLAMLAKQA
jgi:hypothetical protein